MTSMKRIIRDPKVAADANSRAFREFTEELDTHNRRHLVTEAALGRWFNCTKGVLNLPREERIKREFGEPENPYITRTAT